LYEYLIRFILITVVLVGGLWGLRWYITTKWRPTRERPLIKVVERAFLAQGKQGLVVEVGQQRFFVILSDKHSSVTELEYTDFLTALQEECGDASPDIT